MFSHLDRSAGRRQKSEARSTDADKRRDALYRPLRLDAVSNQLTPIEPESPLVENQSSDTDLPKTPRPH